MINECNRVAPYTVVTSLDDPFVDFYIEIGKLLREENPSVEISLKKLMEDHSIANYSGINKVYSNSVSIPAIASLMGHAGLLAEILGNCGTSLLNVSNDTPFLFAMFAKDDTLERTLKKYNTIQVLFKFGAIIPDRKSVDIIEKLCTGNCSLPSMVLVARHLGPGYWNAQGPDSQTLEMKNKCEKLFKEQVSGHLMTDKEVLICLFIKRMGLVDDVANVIIGKLIPMTDGPDLYLNLEKKGLHVKKTPIIE